MAGRAARRAGRLGLAMVSYFPTLRRYRQPASLALALPLIALFYMAATIGLGRESLARHRRQMEEPRLCGGAAS